MARREAIQFEHHDSLVDYVRQHARDGQTGEYSLYECVPAEPNDVSADPQYFLCAARISSLRRRPAQRVTITVSADETALCTVKDGNLWKVLATRSSEDLIDLVSPQRKYAQDLPDSVVFWCRNEEILQRLVSMSLSLGCDHLQYTTVEHKGETVPLLRADRPSYFVIDTALQTSGVQVFTPQIPGRFFVAWDTAHPLANLAISSVQAEEVLFFHGEGLQTVRRKTSAFSWKDIYQLTEFSLEDLNTEESWQEGDVPPKPFTVQLRLSPSHTSREASIWLLPGKDQQRVERLLHAIPEPDLGCLQFSLQEDDHGDEFILIRERHTGHGREYIDFEGVRLAPYAGYPNLLLPIDAELEPMLRKDRYRKIFDLRPGRLTLLWSAHRKLRLAHLQERSFRPLPELVDYIIGTGAENFSQIKSRSVFHFQDYRHAIAAVPERKTSAEKPARKKTEKPEILADAPPTPVSVDTPQEEKEVRVNVEVRTPATEAPPVNQLEQDEIQHELEIISKGQSVDRWKTLAGTKTLLKKHREAATCLTEALWLSQDEKETLDLEGQIIEALERAPEINLAKSNATERASRVQSQVNQEDSDPAWLWLWVNHGARYLRNNMAEASQKGDLHRWISSGHKHMERRGDDLRKKERWLLWNRIIRINGDSVAETKVREGLQEELNERGLRPQDVPQFIQNRIYRSRLIDDEENDTSEELRAALGIIEHIEGCLQKTLDEKVQRIGTSILAYGYERLGDKARSADRFEHAQRLFNDSGTLTNIDRAWIALYLGASMEINTPESGAVWMEAFERLFKQHKEGGLSSSELSTIHKNLLGRVTSESPTNFLSPENFRALYPQAQKYIRAQAIRAELELLIQRGEFSNVLRTLQGLGRQAAQHKLGLSSRELAWLLGQIVDFMHRIGRAAEGVEILRQFEEGAPDPMEDRMSGFYPILYRIKLGEGFMDVGEEQYGMELVCQSVRMAWSSERPLQWLDHLDMLSAALQAIEAAPLEHRLEGVEQVLEALFLDRKHYADTPSYRAIKLRLLDHCVEVGLSKERLSLKRYKHYLDEDEYHVRQRIVTERLT